VSPATALARFALRAACLAMAAAAAEAPPLAARIDGLLSAARSAGRPADARARLDEAETLLKELGGKLDALQRGFFRADILRLRGRVATRTWRREPARAAVRQEARKNLLLAVEEYARMVKLCEGRLDRLEPRIAHADLQRNKPWRELRGYISRANYGEAWSFYRLGLLAEEAADRKRSLDQAVERFSSFTAKGYRKHPIVADCFLGQALCSYELERYFEVLKLLKPARPNNTPPDLFQRMTYLRIQAAQAYGSHLEAENAARQYFDALPAGRKLDPVELGMALERARCLSVLADPKRNPEYHGLFRGRLDEVAKVVYAHGEPWRTELAGVLGTGGGATPLKCLARARELFGARKFRQAVAEAEKGISLAATATDPTVLADLRYAAAAGLANLGEDVEAFRAMADFLARYPADRRAGELCTTAVRTGRRAIAASPPLPPKEFLDFLSLLEKRFAKHPEAAKLAWHRASVMLQAGRFAEAGRLLRAVPAASPVYLLAQYGLAAAAAKQAEALAAGPADANALAELLDGSSLGVRNFARSAGKALGGQELQAAGAVIDVGVVTARRYLELSPPRPKAVLELLGGMDGLAALRDRAAMDRRALRLRAHLAGGNVEAAVAEGAGLLKAVEASDAEAIRSSAEAVEAMAAALDRLVAAGRSEPATRLGEQLVRMQRALLGYVTGSKDPQVRRREPAARLKLAESLRKLGRHTQAMAEYEWLLGNTPRRQSGRAARGLALCCEQTQRYARAADRWAALARGTEKNTDPWYEARYHWIWCLHRQGRRDDARKLLAYFRLRNPKIAIRKWQARFDELAGRIGLPASAPARGRAK